MLPPFPGDYLFYATDGHAKCLGKLACGLVVAFGVFTNFLYIGLPEPGKVAGFSTRCSLSVFTYLVSNVVKIRSEKQMTGVDA
jgi:hypothetical protein